AQGDTNTYWPKIIAKDKNGNADTMTLKIWATKPAASSAKALTAFSFATPAVTGTIIDSSKTVALTAPYGTDVTALVATFATTGASVKIGSVIQTSGTTASNFSSPVTYTVVAADGSTQAYVVTVTIAANNAKALTAFNFTSPAVTGTITESAKTVALTVPYGTDVTALVATFASTGASVKVGSVAQTSGTTANNFTNPVTYTVVAADGSTQNYVVTATVAASTAITITTQPQSQAKCLGAPVSFSVVETTATGTLSYQWKNAAGNLTEGHYVGTTTGSLSIGAVAATDTGAYSCVVTSTAGSKATSAGAILTVNASSTAPSAVNATPSSVCSGGSSTLSLTGGTLGAGAVWKWYADTTAAALSTIGSPISVSPAATTTYYVRAEGTCGNTVYKNVKVSILPSLTVNAINFSVNPACAGSAASETIAISITGGSNPHYQWTLPASSTRQNPGDVASFSLTNVVGTDGGLCKCVVTDDCNSGSAATTKTNTLTVNSQSSTITLAATTPTSICPPGSVTFNITGTLGTGANWSVYANGTKLSTQPTITSNSFTISGINAATSYVVKAEGGSCDNATIPPASAPVAISLSTVNVAFNSNGGSSTPSTQPIACGGTATAPTTAQNPSKTGYTFVGWYLDTSTSTAFNFATPIKASITLNAKWAINTYTVTFDRNGGNVDANPKSETAVYQGNVGSLPAPPTRIGYNFASWNTASTGNGTVFTATTAVTANITVFAQWTPLFTVTYSGTGAPVDNTYYQTNDSVTVLGAGSLVNSGFTLWSWTLNGVTYKTGAKFKMGTSNVTLLPSWVVMDREGNIYDTVTINGSVWMKQNLKTKSITSGNSILIRNSNDWAYNPSTPKCCFINYTLNDSLGVGAFYNAAAITSTNNLAPDGWHVATTSDFDNLIPSGNVANSVAVTGSTYWYNSIGTNTTGFSALGSGYCDSTGFFLGYQQDAYFWANTGIDVAHLYLYMEEVFFMYRNQTTNTNYGYSVRCVKNQ
ncbi:MAG: FISUMP domain-containing protein, partial [Chitinivibrionales bacterium]